MITREQIEKTTAEWEIQNPTLADNVIGVEIMSTGYLRYKRGNGVSAWKSLSYLDKIPPTEEAAKIATNFLEHTTTNGLLIGDKTSGKFVGYRAQVLSDAINILDNSGNIVACFKKNNILFDTNVNLTGKIRGQSVDSYGYKGRDNALIYTDNNPGNTITLRTLASMKTTSGDWSIGTIGEALNFVYTKDTDYNASANNYVKSGFNADGSLFLNGKNFVEYGTWTPTIRNYSGAQPTVSYRYRYGYYYRIGNMVYIFADICPDISNAGGTVAYVSGLPFNHNGHLAAFSLIQGYNVFNHGSSNLYVIPCIIDNSLQGVRFQSPTGASAISWIANVNSSAYAPHLQFSGWYRIA